MFCVPIYPALYQSNIHGLANKNRSKIAIDAAINRANRANKSHTFYNVLSVLVHLYLWHFITSLLKSPLKTVKFTAWDNYVIKMYSFEVIKFRCENNNNNKNVCYWKTKPNGLTPSYHIPGRKT